MKREVSRRLPFSRTELKGTVNLTFGQDHLRQFNISLVVYRSIFNFSKIIKSSRTLSCNIYANHFLMGIDDAKHGLELHNQPSTAKPGDGLSLPDCRTTPSL